MGRLRLNTSAMIGLLPAAGVLATWTYLMFDAGGFRPGTWLPAGLVLAGLLIAAVLGGGASLPAPGPARNALLLLAAFTGWCFVSVLWSDAPGASWEAANLLLVALLGAWVMALAPWTPRLVNGFLLAFSVAAAAACVVALATALAASDLTTRFEDFRFSPPLDYPNSTAAFAFMAAIPALLLAVRPDASVPSKAAGQGLATFLCAFALLPQSRGAILGALATLIILAIAVPYRWRLTLHVGLLALALVVVWGPVGDVYTAAADTGRPSAALEDAAFMIGGVTFFAVVLGAALAWCERRYSVHGEARDQWRRVGFWLSGAAAVLLLAVVLVKAGSISDTVSDQWRSLKNPGVEFAGAQANRDSNRLASADPLERYDYWRVDVQGFLDAPVGGIGAGAFEHRYLEERRYPKVARYPHNLSVKVLGETGLIGLGLILAFLVVVALGLLRGRPPKGVAARLALAAPLAMLGYYVAHGQFDWLEAYPLLTGPALAFPIMALVLVTPEPHVAFAPPPPLAPEAARARRRRDFATALATAAFVLVAGLSLLMPWFSLRYRERAIETWRSNPGVAYRDLDRAASADPLTPEPGTLRGVIGLTSGDLTAAEQGFDEALDREDTWLPHFGLGVVAAAQGDKAAARAQFAIAQRLNRRDPVLSDVVDDALTQKPVLPAQLIRDVLTSPFANVERLS